MSVMKKMKPWELSGQAEKGHERWLLLHINVQQLQVAKHLLLILSHRMNEHKEYSASFYIDTKCRLIITVKVQSRRQFYALKLK